MQDCNKVAPSVPEWLAEANSSLITDQSQNFQGGRTTSISSKSFARTMSRSAIPSGTEGATLSYPNASTHIETSRIKPSSSNEDSITACRGLPPYESLCLKPRSNLIETPSPWRPKYGQDLQIQFVARQSLLAIKRLLEHGSRRGSRYRFEVVFRCH